MIVTLFRSRLRPECLEEYQRFVDSTAGMAETAPGFKGHKLFVAEDGERITLVEFENEEAQRNWARTREHVVAARAGRDRFYSEYKIQVCEVKRESQFEVKA